MPNGDRGLLSLLPELLHEIVQNCPKETCCRLRETCKILQEHADPFVFRRLRIRRRDSNIIENQITALVTRSSRACELTKVMVLQRYLIYSSRESNDFTVNLPIALSALKNMTRFEWHLIGFEPAWLIDSLTQSVAGLPKLTELAVRAPTMQMCNALIPLGLFSNLSKLEVQYGRYKIASFFISQMSTVIANSPHLRCLDVSYEGPSTHDVPLPTLGDLFSKLSANNPLYLEQLHLSSVGTTLDQATLPHLTKLTSFGFGVRDEDVSIVQGVWASFLVNNIKITDVSIYWDISMETMLYLLSLSGLKRLAVGNCYPLPDITAEILENILFAEVLPKHVNSLQVLEMCDDHWSFDAATSGPILKCLELRELHVKIDYSMTIQLLLDTVARLPELMVLLVFSISEADETTRSGELANFNPIQGLRYVENLEIIDWKMDRTAYVLEKDGGRAVRYREI